MANVLFDPGREGFLDGTIQWTTPTIKASLVRGYTFSAAHKFVSDVTGAGGTLVNTSAAFASKTATNGIANAANITFSAVTAGAAIPAVIIYQSSAVSGGADVAATAQRLIAYIDDKFRVEIDVTAASAATTVIPEDLPVDAANAATFTLITGTGPATFTLSALASAGARTLSTAALASGITAGALYEYQRSGSLFPVTPNGGDIGLNWDTGTNKIFKL